MAVRTERGADAGEMLMQSDAQHNEKFFFHIKLKGWNCRLVKCSLPGRQVKR